MLRPLLDAFARAVARLMAGLFFRQVEVVGRPRIPRQGPVVFVANHINSLVDPLLLVAVLPRMPRFLGKSTLWQKLSLRPILALAAVIPVYRRQDEGGDTGRNLATFARCHELLAQGGAIALFPEGISHNQPSLAPLRTGVARIVLEAEERFGPLGARIVPVGLTFDAKDRFRSRVLVKVGEPIDPARERELAASDNAAAVRQLTARVDEGLRQVTLNYDSWEDAALIGRAADLFGRPGLALPTDRSLAEDFTLHQAFIDGFEQLEQQLPAETAAAARQVASYDRLLRAARLEDEQVAARYPMPSLLRRLLIAGLRMALILPLALVGSLLNWVPYRLAGLVSRRIAGEPDLAATYKLFPSLLLFPGFWLAEAGLAAWLAGGGEKGWWAGAATALAAPLLGWLALVFNDRRIRLFKDLRGFWLLATRQRLADELRRRRREAYEAVTLLAQRWASARQDPSPLVQP